MTHPVPNAEFHAKWMHETREDGYCACEVVEFEIDSDNHAFFHLLDYMVEKLPGMDQVILMMADKIVKTKALEGVNHDTKN